MKLFLPSCLAIVASLWSSTALASPDVWTRTGPPGGHVVALVDSATQAGLTYASTEGGRLWKSTDGGVSFVEVADPVAGTTVTSMAFDRTTPSRLYVGTDAGDLLSTDDGASSFVSISSFLDAVRVIVPDPHVDGRLYAATENGGLFRSDDMNASFDALSSLTPFDPFIHALAVDTSNRIYVSVGFGIVWSDDAGATVTLAPTSPANCTGIIIDPLTPSVVYASSSSSGFYRSTDSGVTWASSNTGLGSVELSSLVEDPLHPATLYVGSSAKGVWMSVDSGATWADASSGLYDTRVSRLAFSAVDDALLLGAMRGGIYRRGNGDSAWTRSGAGMLASFVDTTLFVDHDIFASSGGQALFRSTDAGATWSFAGNGLPPRDVLSMAVDASNLNHLYAGTDGDGIYISTDGGATWSPPQTGVGSQSVRSVVVNAADPTLVFLGVQTASPNDPAIFVSHDAGSTWTQSLGNADQFLSAMAFSSANGPLFVASDGNGLLVSTDQGDTFSPSNNGAGQYAMFLMSLAVNTTSGVIYEGQHGGGLAVSNDIGASWAVHDAGLPDSWLTALAPDLTQPGSVFIGTYAHGVVRTHDNGASFTGYQIGLVDRNIASLALSTDASVLVAGTRGGGAFVVEPSELGAGGQGGAGATVSASSASSGIASTSTATSDTSVGAATLSTGLGGDGGAGGAQGSGGGGSHSAGPQGGCSCRSASAPAGSGVPWPVWIAVGGACVMGRSMARRRVQRF